MSNLTFPIHNVKSKLDDFDLFIVNSFFNDTFNRYQQKINIKNNITNFVNIVNIISFPMFSTFQGSVFFKIQTR